MSDSTQIVALMLARAGLPAGTDEVKELVKAYDQQLAGIESMYTVEATRYESPALAFNPTPLFANWG